MNREDSLAWGALLTAQGNGEQLQYDANTDTETAMWSYGFLTGLSIANTRPDNWRIKPKTRTLTVWTWRVSTNNYYSANSDQKIAGCAIAGTLIDTHTIEVEP